MDSAGQSEADYLWVDTSVPIESIHEYAGMKTIFASGDMAVGIKHQLEITGDTL
jgi:hypothetical protein